jgi:hypothetical protein
VAAVLVAATLFLFIHRPKPADSMAIIKKSTETVNGRTLTLWGDPAKFAAVGLDFVPDPEEAGRTINSSVGGHTRKMYPGDPGFSVSGHSRSEIFTPDKQGSTVLPGKPFYIEVTTGTGVTKEITVTRFSYEGRWGDLKSKCMGDLAPAPNIVVRNASGSSKVLVEPA